MTKAVPAAPTGITGLPGQVLSASIDSVLDAVETRLPEVAYHLIDVIAREVVGYSVQTDEQFRAEVADGLARLLTLGVALLRAPRPLTAGERVSVGMIAVRRAGRGLSQESLQAAAVVVRDAAWAYMTGMAVRVGHDDPEVVAGLAMRFFHVVDTLVAALVAGYLGQGREQVRPGVGTTRSGALADLLTGRFVDQAAVEHQVGTFGLDIRRTHGIVLVTAPARGAVPGADPATAAAKAVGNVYPASQGVAFTDPVAHVAMLLPAGDDLWDDRILPQLDELARQHGAVMVAIDPTSTAAGIAEAAQEGRSLLLTASYAMWEPCCVRPPALAVLHLLRSAAVDARREYLESTLGTALLDAQHQGVIQTLQVYSKYGGRIDPMARELALHVNSVRYRLDRICEARGLDRADPETQLRLVLAGHLLRLGTGADGRG